MRLLLDTHVLLWAATGPQRLSVATRTLFEDPNNELMFSAISIWEIAIKTGRGRSDFRIDAGFFRRGLLENGYTELPVTGAHATATAGLPAIHRDPFDRMLIAQAIAEELTLVTSDQAVAKYPGPIRLI
jgi:PIN domain nuclease of toxin-antitoxin system